MQIGKSKLRVGNLESFSLQPDYQLGDTYIYINIYEYKGRNALSRSQYQWDQLTLLGLLRSQSGELGVVLFWSCRIFPTVSAKVCQEL